MPVTKLHAKDFNNRQELEVKVSSMMGLTADSKPGYTIEGTREELYKLHLGHGKSFWGILCVQTDFTPPEKYEKPNRGEIHKSELKSVDIDAYEEA